MIHIRNILILIAILLEIGFIWFVYIVAATLFIDTFCKVGWLNEYSVSRLSEVQEPHHAPGATTGGTTKDALAPQQELPACGEGAFDVSDVIRKRYN